MKNLIHKTSIAAFGGSLLLAAGFISSAAAADAVVYEPAYEPVAELPAGYNWSGAYIGLHAGYGWGDADYTLDFDPNPPGIVSDSFDLEGGFAGVNLGYNYQSGAWVFGAEADASWSGIDGDAVTFDGDDIESEIKWMGSIRGRLGYAFENILPYVTAGVAFAENEINVNGPGLFASDSQTHVGWTAGAGVEVGITQNLSTAFEYRYTDLGSENYDFGASFDTEGSGEIHTVGAALKWRFMTQ